MPVPVSDMEREDFARRQHERNAQMVAVWKLVAIVRAILPLAAAAHVGRCFCGRAIPWWRTGWATPTCEGHVGMERDEVDERRIAKLEQAAEDVCGLVAARGWSTT